MQKFAAIYATLLAVSLSSCRPRSTINTKVLETPSESQPFNCDRGSHATAVVNDNVVKASANATKIFACAQRLLAPAKLSSSEESAAAKLFEGFIGSGCDGCHTGKSSFGGLAQFVSNEGAGQEEFLRGIALRHHFSRKIIETCVHDSPGQKALMGVFTKRRHMSEAGLR